MNDASQFFDPENLSDQEQSRLQKMAALRARGIDPYPARTKRSHTIAAARDLHDAAPAQQPTVTVAGRIKRIRDMGKTCFANLDDGTAQINRKRWGKPVSIWPTWARIPSAQKARSSTALAHGTSPFTSAAGAWTTC